MCSKLVFLDRSYLALAHASMFLLHSALAFSHTAPSFCHIANLVRSKVVSLRLN